MSIEQKIFNVATARLEKGVNLIEASAGTGKTYAIAMIVLRLLSEYSLKIEDILLVTFTRAATEELAARIRTRLVEARNHLRGSHISEDQTLQHWAEEQEDKQSIVLRIEEALLDIDRASVFTIHGFCQRMLQEQALESGQVFDMELKPDGEEIRQKVAQDFWRRTVYALPNHQCGVVLAHFATPSRLYDSVSPLSSNIKRIEPNLGMLDTSQNLFEQAFTGMASWWRENKERLLGDLSALIEEGKFKKAFIDGFSTWHREIDGYFLEDNGILPENLQWLQGNGMALMINGKKVRGKNKEELLRALALPEGVMEPFLVSCRRLLLHIRYELATFLISETERRMIERSCLTYDDLIVRLYRAVNGSSNSLKEILQNRYRAALIDEFQDTDFLQWRIFGTLFGTARHFLYLIGDPKQAIYKFRGADIHSYFLAKKGAHNHYTLTRNYRSHPRLVMEINELFQARSKPFFFDRSMLDYTAVEPAKTEAETYFKGDVGQLDNVVYCQLTQSPHAADGTWSVTAGAEAIMHFFVAETVRLLTEQPEIGIDGQKSTVRPGDIAILVRKKSQAEEYRSCFAEAGVPAVLSGRQSVYRSTECGELVTLLEALAKPGDVELMKKALTLSWFGLSGDELYQIFSDEDQLNKYHSRFQEYGEIWLSRGQLVMMRHFLEGENVYLILAKGAGAERKIANIQHLLELLQEAEKDNNAGPHQLLQWLRRTMENNTQEDELRLESDEEAVRITTMHGAKGLQYPVVFCPFLWYRQSRNENEQHRIVCHEEGAQVVDLGSDNFEKRRDSVLIDDMAEELRLAYVALTRAQLRCYVAWCDLAGRKGGPVDSFHSGLGYLLFAQGRVPYAEQQERLVRQSMNPGVQYIEIPEQTDFIQYKMKPTMEGDDLILPKTVRDLPLSNWHMTSYSAMAATGEQLFHEADTLVREQDSEQDLIFAELPSGANFGNVVHDIFEELPFSALANPCKYRTLIEQKSIRYGIRLDIQILEKLIAAVVNYPLGKCIPDCSTSFSLADLDESRCLKEMGFYYRLQGGDARSINTILEGEETVAAISDRTFRGFLTGFADLIFEHDNRYYIADYKTNNLGDRAEDYNREGLVRAMAAHNYGLQYWLYSLVLHQHLQNFLPAYDHDRHFGGVLYLFVRGMESWPGGVFYTRPDYPTLTRLASCFGEMHG